MNITLDLNGNNWLLEIQMIENGLKKTKRFRDKSKIREYLDLLDSPNKAFIGISDMKLLYDDCTFILKNYRKNKDRSLYIKAANKIDSRTEVINVITSNVKKISDIAKRTIIKHKVLAVALSLAISSGALLEKEILQEPNVTISEIAPEIKDIGVIDDKVIDTPQLDEKVEISFNENMTLSNRLVEIENALSNSESPFNVCSKLDEYALNKLVKYVEKRGDIYQTAFSKYGVDPYLILSLAMTETSLEHNMTIPGGENYNGSAIGVTQIERNHIGETITAFNYETKEYESVVVTEDKLIDLSSNVEICAMMMQNCLDQYDNNIYIAIQAHNYGTKAMDIILQKYADEKGISFSSVVSNKTDCGWMKYVDDMHDNPKNYISNWKYKTYGNNKYIYNVLGYYMGQNIINNSGQNYYIYDLVSNTCKIENKYSEDLNLYVSKTR